MHDVIEIRGARAHNLKNISLDIPKNKFVVITGLSGSGKSSLAFDTLYAEAQRRFMQSMSPHMQQYVEMQEKPEVDSIKGLTPAVAIEQKALTENPRSTVATITDIADYLRVLFARVGVPHCPDSGVPLVRHTRTSAIEAALAWCQGRVNTAVLATMTLKDNDFRSFVVSLRRAGFTEVMVGGTLVTLETLNESSLHDYEKEALALVVQRITPELLEGDPLFVRQQITTALDLGDERFLCMDTDSGDLIPFSLGWRSPVTGKEFPALEPRMFSFNNPVGACPACTGLGEKSILVPELIIPNKKLSVLEGGIKPWVRVTSQQSVSVDLLKEVARKHKFSVEDPLEKLTQKAITILLNGTGDETYTVGASTLRYEGVIPQLERRYKETDSDYIRGEIAQYMRHVVCPSCGGSRFRKESLSVTVQDASIADIMALSVTQALEFARGLLGASGAHGADELVVPLVKEMMRRLENLLQVGLGYVELGRSSVSLSGGEGQRVRLSTQLSTELSGIVYVLDEPSVGLHPRDTGDLLSTIEKLRSSGNTILVVEHDADIIEKADYIIDMGPGAGVYGGEVLAQGTAPELMKNKASVTGLYLSGKKIVERARRAQPKELKGKSITIEKATAHNLKQVTVSFPLGQFVCVTGVSGSGKSTLVLDILSRALHRDLHRAKDEPLAHKSIKGAHLVDKIISVDQSPIGKSPRSNPVTYTGIFTAIRELYAGLDESVMRGYDVGTFSFNVKGGRCETCEGEGYVRIPMYFLPDTFVLCGECSGRRYRSEVLEVKYRGKSIADVLDMSVKEGKEFFVQLPAVSEKLGVLDDVGLGYLKLGQPANTLSGGEAQRVKLATELMRRSTGSTLYVLDEPTTGLHFEDIQRLLIILDRLVAKGNTVVVIEHNLDVIRCADHIIDMGPEGGTGGGELVAQGTPAQVAAIKRSHTGAHLKRVLASRKH